MMQIRILQELKARIERDTNVKLPVGPDEALPPIARRGSGKGDRSPRQPGKRVRADGKARANRDLGRTASG
jgi:hypothetical protein